MIYCKKIYVMLMPIICLVFLCSCGMELYNDKTDEKYVSGTALLGAVEYETPKNYYNKDNTLSKDNESFFLQKFNDEFFTAILRIDKQDILGDVNSYKELKNVVKEVAPNIQINQNNEEFAVSDPDAVPNKAIASVVFTINDLCAVKYYGYISVISGKNGSYIMVTGYSEKSSDKNENSLRIIKSFSAKTQ